MKTSYMVLGQIGGALETVSFVVKVTFFNRVAQKHSAIAGTVITFLASISNLGGMLPGTWGPLLTQAVGLNVSACVCNVCGIAVLLLFWKRLRCIEDLDDVGWRA